jgi:nitrogen fixation/metabolism regulation signal transduction histidine kinase
MNSIGSKIQVALVGSISIVTVCALIMLLINQLNSSQNQQIIQTMTTEYSIISLSDQLVQSYNSIAKNPGNPQFVTDYQALHTKLPNVIATIRKQIISQESKMLLVGVESTVNQVMNECDMGIKEIQNNDFLYISTHFSQANTDNDFVRDNVRALLQKELEYLSGTQEQSQRIYIITITASLSIFVLIVFVMIFFARSFSKQIITPLIQLSLFAKDIAGGNLQTKDKRTLEITQDETGSLTKSIYTMVDKLTEMLDKEQKTSEEIKKASDTLAEKNTELQKMNTIMVGRELKMIELKNEIEELKNKLNKQPSPPSTPPTTPPVPPVQS